MIASWLSNNYIEIFGAVAGIIYVFLEIRQKIWLWPVGIITSAVYIYVFFTGKLYADMSLQGYYLVISVIGWCWWAKGKGQGEGHRAQGAGHRSQVEERNNEIPDSGSSEHRGQGAGHTRSEATNRTEGGPGGADSDIPEDQDAEQSASGKLEVSRLRLKTGLVLMFILIILYSAMWFILDRFTDSPVPEWDSFITSLSIIGTWMLARKIYEHWFLWIIVNSAAAVLFFTRALYPTMILYVIYLIMSFAGLKEWKKALKP